MASLFDDSITPITESAVNEKYRSFIPRPYQRESVESTVKAFGEGHPGALVRLGTGLGKTVVSCFIMDKWLQQDPMNRVIVIAHERQLIWQFSQEICDYFGGYPALEMSSNQVFKNDDPAIIVASRQTLMEREVDGEVASRLFKFDNMKYNWLLVIDEGHRWSYKLKTCKHILEWFEKNPNSRRLVLTATPSRSDKVSLRRICPVIAYDYPHFDPRGGPSAVRDGWCVPYEQKFITVEGLDFGKLKELAGDFDPVELEEILKGELERFVHPMLELVGTKQTLIFNPTVAFAQNVAQFINGVLRPNQTDLTAISINGSTPEDVRKDTYRRFENKEFQFLSVCGLCIAKDSIILTDHGEIPIQDVTLEMRVWDGVEFVSHGGVIYKGHRSVIEYAGLKATGDHNVWTSDGWKALAECKEKGLSIVVSGIGGRPVQEFDNYYRNGNSSWRCSASRSDLWWMRKDNAAELLSTSAERITLSCMLLTRKSAKSVSAWNHKCRADILQKTASHYRRSRANRIIEEVWCGSSVHGLRSCLYETAFRTDAWQGRMQELCEVNWDSFMASLSLSGGKAEVYESRMRRLPTLWGERDKDELQYNAGHGSLDYGKSWTSKAHDTRPDRQQRSLRTGKYSICNGCNASKQSKEEKEEVYDILNAGPRHRFTANGLIVSNCREGYNNCNLEALAMFRPSKNKELVIQMLGRGCRTLKGLLNGLDNVEDRLKAIANSSKNSCLVIDLVGVTNLPAYQSTARLMAEGLPDEIIDEVTEKVNKRIAEAPEGESCDVGEYVQQARAEVESERERLRREREETERRALERARKRAELKAEVKYSVHDVSQGNSGSVVSTPGTVRMATNAQLNYLRFHKIPIPQEGIAFRAASRIIGQLADGKTREQVLATNRLGAKKQQSAPVSIKEFDFSEAFGVLRGE